MNMLTGLMEMPLIKALGSTLFHFLWEGLGAALLLAVALQFSRSSRLRYALACAAMFGMAAAFCVTLAISLPGAYPRFAVPAALPFANADTAAYGLAAGLSEPLLNRLQDSMRWFVPFWLAGLVLFYVRGAGSWLAVRRLRRDGVPVTSALWQNRIAELARRLGVMSTVRLLESCKVDVPVVAGFLRPVIFLPAGLVSGMPVEQLEYLLIHELAHIRRGDCLVNLLQKAIAGLLFYHPAVWWVLNVLDTERENCCDDAVLEACGNAPAYAQTLAALEGSRLLVGAPALAANGGSLMKRIRRLLNKTEGPVSAGAPLVSAAMLIASCAIAFVAFETPVHLAAQQPGTRYERWLNEDVAYIIEDQESAAFKRLSTDEERDKFIEQFWLRRDPTPGTVENEFKDEHYRRIAYANTRYTARLAGWKTDRGRVYITYGPPDEIDSHPSGDNGGVPYEDWRYRHLEGIGNDVIVRFEDAGRNGEYRMTKDPNAVEPTKTFRRP